MPRPATGQVIEKATARGVVFALRFRAYGQRRYVRLGTADDGWTRSKAEAELRLVMAQVELGRWQAPEPVAPPEPVAAVPTFHRFASAWLTARVADELRPRTIEYLRWALCDHLLPHLADVPIDRLTIEKVDEYAQAKAAERRDAQDQLVKARTELVDARTELAEARAELVACREREHPTVADRRRAVEAAEAAASDGRCVVRVAEAAVREATARPGLSNGSINKTLDVLAQVLETAVEYEHLQRNPAAGRRRRLKAEPTRRSHLDRADHIAALLDGGRVVDGRSLQRKGQRRALLATLTFAGLRIGEALALRWADVDLARGTIRVSGSKTAAGVRTVNVLPVLRDELVGYRAGLADDPAPGALVFGTSTGGRQSETNVRRRVLAPAVEAANVALTEAGGEPLPEGLTPHGLRRTFASLLVALGEDPAYVMAQMGHTDPGLTMRLYARQMQRRDGERERLRALVGGVEWAPMGTSPAVPASGDPRAAVS